MHVTVYRFAAAFLTVASQIVSPDELTESLEALEGLFAWRASTMMGGSRLRV